MTFEVSGCHSPFMSSGIRRAGSSLCVSIEKRALKGEPGDKFDQQDRRLEPVSQSSIDGVLEWLIRDFDQVLSMSMISSSL